MDYTVFSRKPFNLSGKQTEKIKEIYASMDIDDKIGQLFFVVGYRQDEEFLKEVASGLRVGGLMCRSMSAEQVTGTVSILQKNAKIPLLIAANLEAGANGIVSEGTKVASQMAVAATGDKNNAYELGRICAEEGAAVGANYAFAPVCDIDLNFRNPITNTRTYGADPAIVADCASEYARACRERGMCYSVKHFPGDGVDERDQHLVTSVNSLSVGEWDKTYGAIYKRLIDEGAPTVMAGHIAMPAYEKVLCPDIKDEDILPASLSKNLLNGLLREKLGFNGLIITDATTMAGFNVAMSRDEAVPGAIAAGCDMFLFTKNMKEDFAFMKAGIERGAITPERLEEAVMRVLALKESMGLFDKNNVPDPATALKKIATERNKQSARKIADESMTLVKCEKGVLPIDKKKIKKITVYGIEGGANALGYTRENGLVPGFCELLRAEGFEVSVFETAGVYEGLQSSFESVKESADMMIYLCNLATKSNQTTVRIEWMNPMGINVPIYVKSIPTVFVSLENPYHLLDVPRVRTYINTYGVNDSTLGLLVDKLVGKSKFKGKSPVDAFCGKWDAKLS